MKRYHLFNNIIGWLVGIAACAVYIMTAEATASWWDCGEYIATAIKLQVGHPPGAPTFQLLGCLFAMFSDPMDAARAVNILSAVCSGLGIMFLYWTITLLGKLIIGEKNPKVSDWRTWAIFGSGIVGAMAYCFSDTYWFSAVEGEVYAMSSFFTAVVFWAVLKWEEQSDDPRSLRWLILVSFLVGMAIGVHLLNLLTIPAIVYVVYFKKWKQTTVKGFIYSGIISVVLLAIVLYGIIPGVVNVSSAFDVFFVNSLGMSFNVGTVIFFLLVAGAIGWGLWYTKKRNKPVINAAILATLMLIVGYSTFFVLVIRANTNTPLNENAPKDAVALRAYLGREQYGQTPLLTGPYYTAGNPIGVKDGYTKYVRGEKGGKDRYIPKAHAQEYEYRKDHCGFFPRMYSTDNGRQHPLFYKYWAGDPPRGQKPTMSQNLRYFNRYQCGWMYWRYFMWNFAGRQNDIQGHYFNDDGTRDYINGNWICGIKAIDEARLGPQDNLPDHLANNKARNVYYLMPLILGIFGLIYHFRRHRKDAFIVLIMFVMTGIAIGVYLNMPPRQPRERDYAFVGSFCFFAIWIGLGVMAIADRLMKWLKNEKFAKVVVPLVFLVCMIVPLQMASQNWDDHDRSEKYAARDFAKNYLGSVNENGVLITFGDNDTFPLWYAQEVEHYRTDVRILNYTLSGMHWYVEQLFNKLYESEALDFTLPKEFYGLGRDVVYIQDRSNDYLEVTEVLGLMRDHPERFSVDYRGETTYILPTKRFKITIDVPALVEAGVIPADLAPYVNPEIKWEINSGSLLRYQLMMLDILGTNKFKRDINIMNPSYIKDVFPLIDYFSIQDGMNCKLLPYPRQEKYTPQTFTYFLEGAENYTYDAEGNMVKDGTRTPLLWGNLNSDIYVDPVSSNSGSVQRQTYVLCAEELLKQGDTVRAAKLMEMAEQNFPVSNFPHDKFCIYMISIKDQIQGREAALEIWNDIYEYYRQELVYYSQFTGKKASGVLAAKEECVNILAAIGNNPAYNLGGGQQQEKVNTLLASYGYTI